MSHVYRVCVRVQGVFSRALFNDQNEGVVTCTPFACRRRSTFHTPVRRDGAPELEARNEWPPTLMANPLGDLLEWLFAANITTSDAFASAKALIEANVTRETLEQATQPTHAY